MYRIWLCALFISCCLCFSVYKFLVGVSEENRRDEVHYAVDPLNESHGRNGRAYMNLTISTWSLVITWSMLYLISFVRRLLCMCWLRLRILHAMVKNRILRNFLFCKYNVLSNTWSIQVEIMLLITNFLPMNIMESKCSFLFWWLHMDLHLQIMIQIFIELMASILKFKIWILC